MSYHENTPQPPPDSTHLTSRDPRLLDYLEGKLPALQQAALEQHVAQCPECQALCSEFHQLDERLTASLGNLKVSSEFEARVLAAIDAQPTLTSEQARREAKARLQAEAELRWAESRKSFMRAHIPGLLDWLSWAAAGGVAISLVLQLALSLSRSSPGVNDSTAMTNSFTVTVAVATGLLFLLGTAFCVARPRFSRLLTWL